MRIGGLDTSSSRTGYCMPSGALHSIVPRTGSEHPARRLDEIEAAFTRLIHLYPDDRPDLIVMEGYSLGFPKKREGKKASPRMSTAFVLGEVGGVLKLAMYRLGIAYVVIPPTSLKLFASGKGTADKTLMTHCANSVIFADGDHGQRFAANDDEGDAFHLRRMGRVAHHLEDPLAEYQLTAIANCGVPGWPIPSD